MGSNARGGAAMAIGRVVRDESCERDRGGTWSGEGRGRAGEERCRGGGINCGMGERVKIKIKIWAIKFSAHI